MSSLMTDGYAQETHPTTLVFYPTSSLKFDKVEAHDWYNQNVEQAGSPSQRLTQHNRMI
jgi:hypothetical protein